MKLLKINQEFYDKKINFLPFNRKYTVRKDLIEGIHQFGFIVPVILIKTNLIDGTEKLYIADGQNRLATAMYLSIEAEAVLLSNKFNNVNDIVECVSGLNAKQNPWTLLNYAQVFAYLGNNHYKTLLSITDKSPYTVGTIANLLCGIRSKASGSVGYKVKNGTFKVNNLESAKYTLKLAAELHKYERVTSRMVLALGYVSSLKHFNEEKFKLKYKQNAKAVKELKLDDYNDIFASWIN